MKINTKKSKIDCVCVDQGREAEIGIESDS